MAKKIKQGDLAAAGFSKCPVPTCGRPFKLNEEQKQEPPKQPPVCPECYIFAQKLVFWLPHIKITQGEPGQTKSGLVVPGNPGFSMVNNRDKR